MVVPYIKLQENPEDKYVSDLDRDIGDILIDEKLPTDSKVKLYNIALQKYQKNFNPKTQTEDSKSLNKISDHLQTFVNKLSERDDIKPVDNQDNTTPGGDEIDHNTNLNNVVNNTDDFSAKIEDNKAHINSYFKKRSDSKFKKEEERSKKKSLDVFKKKNQRATTSNSRPSTRSKKSQLVKGINSNMMKEILETSLANYYKKKEKLGKSDETDNQMDFDEDSDESEEEEKKLKGNGAFQNSISSKNVKPKFTKKWISNKIGYFK